MINIKNKKLLLIICVAVMISTGVIGLTLSFFTSSDQVVNKLEVGDVDIENEEVFKPDEPNEDGSITKTVRIKNVTTKTPALVRVNITPRWVEIKSDGTELPWSGDASSNVVKLNFYKVEGKDENQSKKEFDENWLYGEDDYYYYKSILQPNKLTYPILQSVKIDLTKVTNPKDYEGKTLIVDVNSEAVQPTQRAYMDAWGTIPDNIKTMLDTLLGITNSSKTN